MIEINSLVQAYRTVKNTASAQLIEKKSRFIASVKQVVNEDEAIEFINNVEKQFAGANHNTYAYSVLIGNIMRYSDNGEPQGTAGIPILEVIRKEGLTDICVVVTRYFGGTLLGKGGLIRAYSGCAKLGIDAAIRIERALCNIIEISCDYNLVGKIQHKIASDGYNIEASEYGVSVSMQVCIEIEKTDNFILEIVETTNALAICKIIHTRYIDKIL